MNYPVWRIRIIYVIKRFYFIVVFFFQAEDGIRDKLVTGVQTCALPIFGSIGVVAAAIPCWAEIKTPRAFALYWMAVSVVAAVAAFLLVRRQALKEAEPFWSLPTRRVTHALAPAFLIGLACGIFTAFAPGQALFTSTLLAIVWITAYGCALHAAAFFMPRGMRLLGGIFVASGIILLGGYAYCPWLLKPEAAHYLMGIFFGVLHLAYGIYLYFTEKQKQAA